MQSPHNYYKNEHHEDGNWAYYSYFNPIQFTQKDTSMVGTSFPAWGTHAQNNINVPGTTIADNTCPYGYSVIILYDMQIIQLINSIADSFYNCGSFQTIMIGF